MEIFWGLDLNEVITIGIELLAIIVSVSDSDPLVQISNFLLEDLRKLNSIKGK